MHTEFGETSASSLWVHRDNGGVVAAVRRRFSMLCVEYLTAHELLETTHLKVFLFFYVGKSIESTPSLPQSRCRARPVLM